MKKFQTIFLQAIIALGGVGIMGLMLWEPHLEGVNAQATSLFEIYFDDPFLAYAYLGSIPFFIALYQAFKLVGFIRDNKLFSSLALKALRMIKYGVFTTSAAIVSALAYLRIGAMSSGDDPAGAIMLGLVATLTLVVVGTAASLFAEVVKEKLTA